MAHVVFIAWHTKFVLGLPVQSLKQAGIATSPLHNMTVRALVKEGRVDDAIQLLDAMVLSDGAIVPEAATVSKLFPAAGAARTSILQPSTPY